MDTDEPFKRDVLVSVRPEYASKIFDGEKTVELRRKFPESPVIGSVVLIYSSSPVSAIVGSAQIKAVRKLRVVQIWAQHGEEACISKKDFDSYFRGLTHGFAILLTNARLLKEQIGIVELQQQFGIAPPQSYRYVQQGCSLLLSNERVQGSYRYQHRHRP
jgi:predicted transcriptional regulator